MLKISAEGKERFNCYVDEAGDEGFKFGKGSSDWFFLTGVIVRVTDEPQVRGSIDRILKRAWTDRGLIAPGALHWRDLDHNRKIVAVNELADLPFTFMSVGIWKTRLTTAGYIRQSGAMFRYAGRLLLERASWYVAEQDGYLQITFSNRNRFHPELLRSYIIQILYSGSHEIRPVFQPSEIQVRNNAQMKMLQVADACAGATFEAFSPDSYGNVHPYYLQEIAERLYRRSDRLFSYGLKMFPDAVFKAQYQTLYPFVTDL